jgi:phage tail protein X
MARWSITGSGTQINTGKVGVDQRQVYARGTQDTSLLLAAQTKLADQNAAVEEHAAELSNPDLVARRTASRIREELNSPNPDLRRIKENLTDLGLAVGTVASIITIL